MALQCSLLTEPWAADTFAVIGYLYKLTPRDTGVKMSPGVELVDPEILFQYPPPPPPDDDTDQEANRINNSIVSVIKMEFCRRDGYRACDAPEMPTFHSITLTAFPEGRRTHVSVLTFYEAHKVERNISFHAHVYVPKFLIFLSKLNMADFFKQCLDTFYTKFFIEKADTCYLNKAIAMLVQNIRVPLPGRFRQLDFGFGQCLTIQAQAPVSIPRTGLGIYRLFHQLGIHFVVEAVRCLLNELNVVIFSKDLGLVTSCCESLVALLWPFPYNYVFAPCVGRRVLDDLLEAPTVFCVGTSYLPEDYESIFQTNGIVLVDLDNVVVKIPQKVAGECLNFDEKPRTQLLRDLTAVVSSAEFLDDWNDCSRNIIRAKRIEMRLRACFLRLYTTMFAHYRLSLSAVRFYPQPRVFFDVAHFFGEHGFKFGDNASDNSLTLKMINSFFAQFFVERYHPFREVDLFDELCAKGSDYDLDEITRNLLAYEANSVDDAGNDSSLSRLDLIAAIHATSPRAHLAFPRPSCLEIVDILKSEEVNDANNDSINALIGIDCGLDSASLQRVVPVDLSENTARNEKSHMILSFLGLALDRLFTNNDENSTGISTNDKRLLNSVLLDSPSIRRQFCAELSRRSLTMSGRLNCANFEFLAELIARLIELETQADENGIACALLQAVSNISNRPSPGEKTLYLHHKLNAPEVWWNESFWLSWLGKFIAAELAAHYSGETMPDLYKEPGHSMAVLADVLARPPNEAKRQAEERRIIEGCRLCIDLMLPLLLDHPTLVSPDKSQGKKKKVGLFKRLNSNKTKISPPVSPNSQHRQRVAALISSVISQFTSGVYLPEDDKTNLLHSIVEKINHQD